MCIVGLARASTFEPCPSRSSDGVRFVPRGRRSQGEGMTTVRRVGDEVPAARTGANAALSVTPGVGSTDAAASGPRTQACRPSDRV